jgi:hypothetical protein
MQRNKTLISSVLRLSLILALASVASAGDFDSPENAVRALEQAYIQMNADSAVAAMEKHRSPRDWLS